MSEILRNLKLKDTTSGKVLTTNENGIPVSSDKNVADLVTSDITDGLANRISALEGNVETAVDLAKEING